MRLLILALLSAVGTIASAAAATPFFAMNTIARGGPGTVAPMLKEFGYDGLGGSPGDAAMAGALEAVGLRLFNGYLTLEITGGKSALDDGLRRAILAMKGHDCALWVSISRVSDGGKTFPSSSPDGDEVALTNLKEIATFAESCGVSLSLYPHAGTWLERFDDAVRVATKASMPNIGATFNLCHWLKVEGPERDPEPVLRQSLPRLTFVTVNGADAGDTKSMGWNRLIQPLDRGNYDVAGFLAKVHRAGYGGPIGFQGYGISEDPRAVLARTMIAWKQIWAGME